MYDGISQYIKPELYILVFVLYIIGNGLKKSFIPDKCIPVMLGICGTALACVYIFSSLDIFNAQTVLTAVFSGITQGLLCAGCSVYINQIIKQINKKD